MQREERFLEDVLKIFHNSKGSVKNTISKWQETVNNEEHIHAEWKPYPEVPFNHAAGQYEPLLKKATHPTHDKQTKQIDYLSESPTPKLDS